MSEKLSNGTNNGLSEQQVEAFFSPSSKGEAGLKTKIDISDGVQSHSKTLTFQSTEVLDMLEKDADLRRLDSTIDPNLTAELDEVALKLGFNPAKSGSNGYLNSKNEVSNKASTEKFKNGTVLNEDKQNIDRKHSFITNLMRRISTSRSNMKVNSSTSISNQTINSDHNGNSLPRQSIFKRWLSTRSRRSPRKLHKSDAKNLTMPMRNSCRNRGCTLSLCLDTRKNACIDTPSNSQPSLDTTGIGYQKEFLNLDYSRSHDNLQNPVSVFNGSKFAEPQVLIANHNQFNNIKSESVNVTSSAEGVVLRKPNNMKNNVNNYYRPALVVEPIKNYRMKSNNDKGDTTKINPSDSDLAFKRTNFFSSNNNSNINNSLTCDAVNGRINHSFLSKPSSPDVTRNNYTPSYLSVTLAAYGYHGCNYISMSDRNLNSSSLSQNSGKSSALAPRPISPTSTLEDTEVSGNYSQMMNQPPPWRLPSTSVTLPSISTSINEEKLPHKEERSTRKASPTSNDQSPFVNADSAGDLHMSTPKKQSIDEEDRNMQENNRTLFPKRERPNTFRVNASNRLPFEHSLSHKDGHESNSVQLRRNRTKSQNLTCPDDQEHWQRNSLIMLTVAHNSPRAKTNSTLQSNNNNTATATTPLGHSFDTNTSAAQQRHNMSVSAYGKLSFNGAAPPSPSTGPSGNNFALAETNSKARIDEHPDESTPQGNSVGVFIPPKDIVAVETDAKDGRHFHSVADNMESILREKIAVLEKDIAANKNIPEDSMGHLCSTVGKANLLLAEKFSQFRDLCDQNLAYLRQKSEATANEPASEGGEMVTLSSDLDGFWAMVMLQVDDVMKMLDKADRLREHNWDLARASSPEKQNKPTNGARKSTKSTAAANRGKIASTDAANSKGKEASARALAAKQRLQMAKREMMARRQAASSGVDTSDSKPNKEDVFLVV